MILLGAAHLSQPEIHQDTASRLHVIQKIASMSMTCLTKQKMRVRGFDITVYDAFGMHGGDRRQQNSQVIANIVNGHFSIV